MSLVRLALRHRITNVLSGEGQPAPPTIAGNAVFDTKITMPEHKEENSILPAILIYTDKDERLGLNRSDGRQYTEKSVTVVIECVIGTYHKREPVDGEDETNPTTWQVAQTDAEMEAMLDLFEWQVEQAILNPVQPANPAHNLKMVKRFENWSSEPAREGKDQASKLAMRQITFEAVVKNDCRPETAVLRTGESLPALADAPYFDAPYLAALKTAIDSSPGLENLRDQLRAARTGVPIQSLPKLETIGISVDNIDPHDPTRPDFPPGQVGGPDGRIEIAAEVQLEGE